MAAAPSDQPTGQAEDIAATAAEDARNRVLKIAKSYLPAEIRVSAWNALRSSRGDAAISEWLAPGGGFDAARQRALDTRARNKSFCERVMRTHIASLYPATHDAAERAFNGSAADQAAFVRSGYAEAQKRDRTARETEKQHQREVADSERDYVHELAERDPGEQVRVAAQWALRPGTSDADIEEFYGYGWAAGASLDLEGYRMRATEAEVARHRTLSVLITRATAAEQALKGAVDAAKARAEAERAWRDVADHAEASRRAWLAEQQRAEAQADNWRKISRLSEESADQLRKTIGQSATANQDSWAKEQSEAAQSAAFWKDMSDQAQGNEKRVKS